MNIERFLVYYLFYEIEQHKSIVLNKIGNKHKQENVIQ